MLNVQRQDDLKDQLDAIVDLVEMDTEVVIIEANSCASISCDGVDILVLHPDDLVFALAYILRAKYRTLE